MPLVGAVAQSRPRIEHLAAPVAGWFCDIQFWPKSFSISFPTELRRRTCIERAQIVVAVPVMSSVGAALLVMLGLSSMLTSTARNGARPMAFNSGGSETTPER